MKTARALSSVSSSARMTNLRIELFFSSTNELRERISFLRSKGVTAYNLVNKSNRDDILESVRVIEEEFTPDCHVSICAHYSLKYNKSRKMDGAYHQLKDFVEDMNKQSTKNEILLINGSGPKGKFNTVTALQRLTKESIDISPSMAVAFNPFFPSEKEYEEEKMRLQQKLDRGVDKVYLQFGTSLERLQTSLQFLTELQTTSTQRFDICGSVFLPTKKLIAQQKFRPWNGVFLSEEFLASEDGARGIVLQLMRLYEKYGCEILIEAPGVRNEKDWLVVETLLAERDQLIESNSKSTGSEASSVEAKVADSKCNQQDEKVNAKVKRRKTDLEHESKSCNNIPPTTMPAKVLAKPGLVLFHSHDVRVHDNVALQMASHHEQVIPVLLWSKQEQGKFGVTGCLEVVLKDALRSLDRKLQQHDLNLVCREGEDSSTMLQQICNECGVGAVYWNKEHHLKAGSVKKATESL